MNPALRFRLLQRAKAKPEFRLWLLGQGLDAIIQHVSRPPVGIFERTFYPGGFVDRRMPIEPAVQHRLDRYQTAMAMFDTSDLDALARRQIRGERVKARARRSGTQRINSTVVRLDDARLARRWKAWR